MSNSDNLQEIHFLEQGLQNLLLQKQAFQMELAETSEALKELEKSGEEVFKIVGQIMLKSKKSKIAEELKNKEKIIEIRLRAIERQEKALTEQLEKAREPIVKTNKK